MKKLFKYIEPIWLGTDNKLSLKNLLVIFFSWKLVENIDYGVRKWASDKSLSDLTLLLAPLAGLIAALLGLSIYNNLAHRKIESAEHHPVQPAPTTVIQKAEHVSGATQVKDMSVEKVDTVNSQTTTIQSAND